MEVYRKHRPGLFKHVEGQEEAVAMLRSKMSAGQLQHYILFIGPSGCGKTTLARITAKALKCGSHDLHEINCADFRGIDLIRDIRDQAQVKPISGDTSVWIIDEAHQLTKEAMSAFLKMLEDPPDHVYFMLCTTDPSKLLKTMITRATEVKVKLLGADAMSRVLKRICAKEKFGLSESVEEKIINVAEGSARKALVLLEAILNVKDEEEQLAIIQKSDYKEQASRLFGLLINPRTQWGDMAKVLKDLDDEPESLRYYVLAAARNVLLGNGKMKSRAFLIIQAFRDNFYDGKNAALAAACYEVLTAR